MRRSVLTIAWAVLAAISGPGVYAHGPNETHIVGSSTVAPYARAVKDANRGTLGNLSIGATGTGSGLKLFCESRDISFAPIAMASRRMTEEERKACAQKGIAPREVEVGWSAIVIARSAAFRREYDNLDRRTLFLALAARVPREDDSCRVVANKTELWSDVDPALPDLPISVYGPALGSGTLDSFIDLVLAPGAEATPCLADLKTRDPEAFERLVHRIRSDGAWVDTGENDGVAVGAVMHLGYAVGILNYAAYSANSSGMQALRVDGHSLSEANLRSGAYPLGRPLFLYVNERALRMNPQARLFLDAFLAPDARGPGGYLTRMGLMGAD